MLCAVLFIRRQIIIDNHWGWIFTVIAVAADTQDPLGIKVTYLHFTKWQIRYFKP